MGMTMRDAFGKKLAAMGYDDPKIVVLDADVSSSTKSSYFAQAFPERFFNVGVAEANMVDVAAGLALGGYRPVANSFAIFLALKATDQIRNVLCYNEIPVVLAGAYGGLSDSFDGASHHSIADLAIMRSLPSMRVLVPADNAAAERALELALVADGPVYIRLNRNELPAVPSPEPVEFGKARILRSGDDLTIAACGICVAQALEAAEILASEGIGAEVLDMASVKPLDAATLGASVARTGRLVTAEEGSITGGLAAACAEALTGLSASGFAGTSRAWKAAAVGLHDTFTESGPYKALLDKYGISAKAISAAGRALARQ